MTIEEQLERLLNPRPQDQWDVGFYVSGIKSLLALIKQQNEALEDWFHADAYERSMLSRREKVEQALRQADGVMRVINKIGIK